MVFRSALVALSTTTVLSEFTTVLVEPDSEFTAVLVEPESEFTAPETESTTVLVEPDSEFTAVLVEPEREAMELGKTGFAW